ncbi:MAG: diadenylate cyclase [Halobacteriota archaeon]|nr:diadenylate cyclase [Halobacteriota archaeon]
MKEIKRAVADAALKVAEDIGANSIIVLSRENMLEDAKTKIPVLHIKRSFMPAGQFISTDLSQKNISRDLFYRTTSGIGRLEDEALVAYINSKIKGELIVGVVDFNNTDSIIVLDLNETEVFKKLKDCGDRVNPEVIRAVLFIALKLGVEGYEGRKIGTAFIVGDSKEVLKRSYQSVLNPFKAHDVNITDPENWNVIKEFAQLDGMFIVSEQGNVLNAGRYIKTGAKNIEIQSGLGGRHIAAASISYDTQALGITLSQSGVVRLYRDGVAIIEFDSDTLL